MCLSWVMDMTGNLDSSLTCELTTSLPIRIQPGMFVEPACSGLLRYCSRSETLRKDIDSQAKGITPISHGKQAPNCSVESRRCVHGAGPQCTSAQRDLI